jgi:ubiquinone/menaquinone biosynthesis C-methylase UbiE
MTDEGLYDLPDLYDVVMGAIPEAEAFYAQEARKRGENVLALACGTGRYAAPLARSGLKVTGGDLSASMLEHARAKSAAQNVRIEFLGLDMRDFSLPGRSFDLVMIAGNALLHLHTIDEFRSCFRAIARHLAPGGALALDVVSPSLRIMPSPGLCRITTRNAGNLCVFNRPTRHKLACRQSPLPDQCSDNMEHADDDPSRCGIQQLGALP